MIKYISLLLLLSMRLVAMDYGEEETFLDHVNIPIARAIKSSDMLWRWPLSHTENRLEPIDSIYEIMNGLISLSHISYQDTKVKRYYYAHQDAYHYGSNRDHTDTCYWVTDNRRDIAIELPFQPHHLALNAAQTILLIEGWRPTIANRQGEIVNHPINNALAAYSLTTKKLYQLYDYKALYGHKITVIGFKENSAKPIAVAEFGLSHQEWDLSELNQR